MAQVQTVYGMAADVKAATVAAVASGKGRVFTPTYATADKGGWCNREVVIDRVGEAHWRRDPARDGKFVREPSRTLSMRVRCRRCEGCLKERRCMWAKRAEVEWHQASLRGGRTWFLTNTFRPEEHYKLLTATRMRLAEQGVAFDALPWRERYREQLREYHGEVSRFLDRLRRGLRKRGWGKLSFRYLCVPEPHQSGHLHYHMLLHEADAEQRIVKLRIEEAWWAGFVKSKLVESQLQCRYVTKYLGKHHFEGRLRNSEHYGDAPAEVLEAVRASQPDLREALWRAERDPCAEAKADVVDLREPLPWPGDPDPARAIAPPRYGAVGVAAETVSLRDAPLPPMPMLPARAEHGDALPADAGVRSALLASGADVQGDGDSLRLGDEMGVCPSGLHIGKGCDCEEVQGDMRCDPPEVDEYRGGIPRRKWPLRGWHEPIPGRGAPGLPRPDRVAAMLRARQRGG